jgi:hypothetical protein
MAGEDKTRLSPLPVRPRPAAGESVSGYIRRLAVANHLRPSYLHSILRKPFPSGPVSPKLLAVLSGRPVQSLKRALDGLGAGRHWPSHHDPAAAIVFLRGLIDACTAAEPRISPVQLWKRLVDEHEADISYGPVYRYIRSESGRAESTETTATTGRIQ